MKATSVEGLTLTQDGSVLTAVLDRPGGNLVTLEIAQLLTSVLLSPPDGAHLFVLRAKGGVFCMGRERGAVSAGDLANEVNTLIALHEALHASPLVSVAGVQGDAAGFGVGLAALCDLTVAVEGAAFQFPEVTIGLAPALVLAWLPRVVGRRQAFWLTATGRAVRGQHLVELGLASEIVTDAPALDRRISELTNELTTHPARVHAEIRSMVNASMDLTLAQAYELSAGRLVIGSMRRTEL
jgi:methylglutaconyl-CoA hydratase